MIDEIIMSNCATYGKEDSVIKDCKKINFIYGGNGSGKTTLGNYLINQSEPKFSCCSLKWHDHPEKILVYNREFRNKHFLQTNVPGVFTLGDATIEDINALNALKNEHDQNIKKLDNYSNRLAKQNAVLVEEEKQFENNVWKAIYLKYKSDYDSIFAGIKSSKRKFAEYIKSNYKKFISHKSQNGLEELSKEYNNIVLNKPDKYIINNVNVSTFSNLINEIINFEIWDEVIVGNQDVKIAELINSNDNSNWVNAGRKYLTKYTKICPFCQKETINDEFINQLEKFFDDRYKAKIEDLNHTKEKFIKEINLLCENLDTFLNDLKTIPINDLPLNIISDDIKLIREITAKNIKKIEDKINEPTRKIKIDNYDTVLKNIADTIDIIKEKIDKYNKQVDNYNEERARIIFEIWSLIVKEQKELIDNYNKKVNGLTKGLKSLEEDIKKLEVDDKKLVSEIENKGKNITGVQATVNEINRLLKSYGYTNFKIVNSSYQDNCYCIQRENGELATHTLSEGEETFISFLYFMQYCKGSLNPNEVADKKIIVLDDPISSLDSTVLYIVSSIVKDLINKIKKEEGDVSQLFVLTHNVFFHKEASFIDGRTTKCKDVNYWIIKKEDGVSKIKSYGQDNPISTSYELLWKEIKESTNNSLVTLQNTMRRIIENYFGMLGNIKYQKIRDQFQTVEEKMVYDSLLYWINDGSHSIPEDLYIDSYNDSPEKYKEVFKSIFYKTGNEAHYKMMMGITDDEQE